MAVKSEAEEFQELDFRTGEEARKSASMKGATEVLGPNTWWVGTWLLFKDGSVVSIDFGFGYFNPKIKVENPEEIRKTQICDVSLLGLV